MIPADVETEEVSTCLICENAGTIRYRGMRDRLFGAPGVWSVSYCPSCALGWLNPRPIRADMEKIYRDYYTHDSPRGESLLSSLRNKVEESLLTAEFGYGNLSNGASVRWAGKLMGALLPMAEEIAGSSVMWLDGRSKGRLLDVGCGNGSFLARMRELGWDVTGVEPDAASASIAKERFGISINVSTLEEANLPPGSFDCVTANQTIEHVYNPILFLKEVFRVLKPGGKLVVTTPSILSMGHKVFRRSWRGLEPPRHLYLFSCRALRICVERIGFRTETLRTTARSTWQIWYESRSLRRDGKMPSNFPHTLNPRLRFEGLVFQLFQHFSLRFSNKIGEQIVLIVSKRA